MSEENFKADYGVQKPSKDSPAKEMVLYCLKGKRAIDAADRLLLLGFKSIVYRGSFHDWRQNGGKIESLNV